MKLRMSLTLTGTPDMFLTDSLISPPLLDRKSTRLNSSHSQISYAVFCLKKKTPCLPRYWLLHVAVTPNRPSSDHDPAVTRSARITPGPAPFFSSAAAHARPDAFHPLPHA